MTPPLITALFAALGGLFYLWLTARVIFSRRDTRTSLGDGGNEELERRIRGHANAGETMPIFFILLGLGEMIGTPAILIVLIGLLHLVGRLMHGLRFNGIGPANFRVAGMAATIFSIAGISICLFFFSLAGLA